MRWLTFILTVSSYLVAFQSHKVPYIEILIEQAIAKKEIPGMVMLVAERGKIHYNKATGFETFKGKKKIHKDMLFDLASLTKPVITATAILQLKDQGRIDLNDKVQKYLPHLQGRFKDQLEIWHLLSHCSGLPPYKNFLYMYGSKNNNRSKIENNLLHTALQEPPGTLYNYSDLNYMLLGFIIERITDQPLDKYAKEQILKPLGMNDSSFLPSKLRSKNIVPTLTGVGNRGLRGSPCDPNARAMGGVAGSAGLFSSSEDLYRYADMLLNLGQGPGGDRFLSVPSVLLMMTPSFRYPGHYGYDRSIGWVYVGDNAAHERSVYLPEGSIFHTGWAGVIVCIDVENELIWVFLSARAWSDDRSGHSVLYRNILKYYYTGSEMQEAVEPKERDLRRGG